MTFSGSVNTQDLERKFLRAARDLHDDFMAELDGIGVDAELVFQSVAPKKTGRLGRGITSQRVGDEVHVTAHAQNPKTGYDYVGVTRFGHRKSRIYPRRVWAHSGPPRAAALKTPFGYFTSVRGFKPRGDWAAKGVSPTQKIADARLKRFGGQLTARLS